MKKISFSSFDLKVIALGLMTLDHIYYFLQGILPVLISVVLLKELISELSLPVLLALNVVNAFLPSPLFVEGSFMMILLGAGIYFLKENRMKFAVFYLLVCLVFLLSIGSFTYENLFMFNYQWMMVFVLPLMLLYNGKQGLKMKYFFYLYYPLHVYALAIVARLLV